MHWNVNVPNRWDLGRKSHHIALPMYTRCYLTCANPTMFYIHLVKWWQGLYKIYCTVMGVGLYSPALSYSQNIFVLCRAVEILMPSSWQKARAVYSGRKDRWECEVPHLHWIPVSDFCKLTGWCPSRSCLYLFCIQYIVPKNNVRYTDFSLAFYFRTEEPQIQLLWVEVPCAMEYKRPKRTLSVDGHQPSLCKAYVLGLFYRLLGHLQ